ncbi:MAG: outer membrane beta-barrel protein [Terracidiphilus sp.]
MKRTLLLSILAMVPAALLSLAATSQVAQARKGATVEGGEPSYKYEFYAGYGYTSINQVNGARYGLQGVDLSVTRDWGKYFGIIADGGYYKYPLKAGSNPNPGNPVVDSVLFGPVFHANFYKRTSVFVRALLGGEHSGGENQTPNISFAGGAGIGMEYKLSPRLSLRASGDDIASSFSLINNSPSLAYSPHRTRSSRASFGVVYRF